MASGNQAAAQINVNVVSNASTAIPKQVQQGLNSAQKFANQHPIKISVDAKTLKGLNLQKQLGLGIISREAQEFDKSIKAATARTLAFGIAAGSVFQVIRAFSALVTTSIEVEKTLKEIQVISNASVESFKSYEKGIFNAARATSESFGNASKAALEFARQGLTLQEQLSRTQNALILTKTAGIQVDKAVEAITASMNTFNNQLRDSTDLVDRLTAVDNAFAVSTGDLAEGLERVGNTAGEAKVSLNETLGAITALQTRTARGGAVIGNALKSIFTRVGRPENVELLNSLNIATEEANGSSRNAISILKDLAAVYKNLGDSQKRQIGEQIAGLYQINQFNALIQDLGSNYSILDQATNRAANSMGSANERIKELNTTTAALLQQTGTSFTQLASQIGKLTFEAPLKNILSSGGGILGGLTDLLGKVDSEGETTGSKFAEGILKGIGNVLGGSGLILIGRALGPLFAQFAKFTLEVLRNSIGVTASLKSQIELQNRVNTALALASAEDRLRIANAQTLNQQMELTLQLMRAQSQIKINPLTSAMYNAGVRPSGSGGVKTIRKFASGYTPNVVRQEIGAIKTSPDYSGARNARPQLVNNFSIGGKRQPIIINSAEKIVATKAISSGYTGPDKLSILNPRQQKSLGLASGFSPVSLSDVNRVTNKSDAYKLLEILQDSGNLPAGFSMEKFKKSNTQAAIRQLKSVVSQNIGSNVSMTRGLNVGPKISAPSEPAQSSSFGKLRSSAEAGLERLGLAEKKSFSVPTTPATRELEKRRKTALKAEMAAERKSTADYIKAKRRREKEQIENEKDYLKLEEQNNNLRRERVRLERKQLASSLSDQRRSKLSDFSSFLQNNDKPSLFFERNLNKELSKLSPTERRMALANNTDVIGTRRLQSSQRRDSISQIGSIGLGLGLPIAAGLVDSFAGGSAGGRALSSGLNLAGAGAAVGGFFGPVGLGVGAGLGFVGGIGSSLISEKKLQSQQGTAARLQKVSDRDAQLGTFSTFVQQQAGLKDLISQGNASPEVLKTQAIQLANTLKTITDPDLIKKISRIDPNDPEATAKYARIQVEQEEKNRQKERRIVAGDDIKGLRSEISSINNGRRGSFSLSKFGLAPKGYAGSDIANLNRAENQSKLNNLGLSLAESSTVRSGVTSKDFTLDRSSRSAENKLGSLLTPESFKKLSNELTGITGRTRTQIFTELFNNLKRLSEVTEQTAESIKQPFNRNDYSRLVANSTNSREIGLNKNSLTSQRGLFKKELLLQAQSPFLSELQKALNDEDLRASGVTASFGVEKSGRFNGLIDQIRQSVPGDKVGFVGSQLKSLESATPENIGDIINEIKSQISKADADGKVATNIDIIVGEFEKNNKIAEDNYRDSVERTSLTKESLKKQNELAKSISSFGGLSGLLSGNRLPSINGNSAATFRTNSFTGGFSSQSIVGFQESKRLRDAALISGGRTELSSAQELKGLGFGDDLIGKLTNKNLIKNANTTSIRNNIFGYAQNLVGSNPLSQFRDFSGSFKNAEKSGNLDAVISDVSKTKFTRPDNIASQQELIKKLQALNEGLDNAGKTSENQVDEALKQNTEALVKVTDAMIALAEKLGLTQVNDKQNTQENGFGNINIIASASTDEKLIQKFSEALNSLNYSVEVIKKQTKTIIPPKSNPFSSINNSQITL